ncbi:unnamed protein product [Ectocarpus sp. 12 AP-2014]
MFGTIRHGLGWRGLCVKSRLQQVSCLGINPKTLGTGGRRSRVYIRSCERYAFVSEGTTLPCKHASCKRFFLSPTSFVGGLHRLLYIPAVGYFEKGHLHQWTRLHTLESSRTRQLTANRRETNRAVLFWCSPNRQTGDSHGKASHRHMVLHRQVDRLL